MVVTAGLVIGNFLMFTPHGEDGRSTSSMPRRTASFLFERIVDASFDLKPVERVWPFQQEVNVSATEVINAFVAPAGEAKDPKL